MNATRIFSFLTCAVLAFSAQAQYGSLSKDAVVSRFNKTDNKLMKNAMNATLVDPADDATHDWKNDKSGASGTVSSMKAYQNKSAPCRDLKITNHYKTETGESTYQFCKNTAGAWKLVGPAK